jgi:hypothetical protein
MSPTGIVPSAGIRATFSIRVSQDFGREELGELVRWIEQMSETTEGSLTLENVKSMGSNSWLFIFEVDRVVFLRLCGLPGVQLICENRHEDFSWLLRPTCLPEGLPLS